jgi:hypothetical protein
MAIFMTSSLMGLVGFRADWDRYIPENIPRRSLRLAARRLDPIVVRPKFDHLAPNLGAAG